MKQVLAILVGDIHLREDVPVCRTDDYHGAQSAKLKFLRKLQMEHDAPVICAGDVFHHWKPSPSLLTYAMVNLPVNVLTIPGQHDLPQHSIELFEKSGLRTLEASKRVFVLEDGRCKKVEGPDDTWHITGFPFGSELAPTKPSKSRCLRMAVCHTLTWHNSKPFPGCTSGNASQLLRKLKDFDLVLTGDNHSPFVVKKDGRLLVNPGSMMRMTADQNGHLPRVYLWRADNSIERVFIPIDKGVITREHIDSVQERDKRIEAFVSRLHDDWEVGLSFERNIKEFFGTHKVCKNVRQLIMEACDAD